MGKLIIVTAPSGAGKTTVVRHLLNSFEELAFSVSATTRTKRENEEEGRDYYFMDVQKFKTLIEDGAFLEWEEVYENQFYGTLKKEAERLWSA
ncbi:MAG: guanylate kinase, partial [Saprospiraceae bacterium]